MPEKDNPTEPHTIFHSEETLDLLAEQLALNYFNNCSIDFLPNQHKNKTGDLKKLRKIVFDSQKENIISSKEKDKVYRNILVIGAGATYNAFENIPLANEAVSRIQKQIVIAKVPELVYDKENNEHKIKYRNLSFDYFIKFYQYYKGIVPPAFEIDESNLRGEFNDLILNNYLSHIIGIDQESTKELGLMDFKEISQSLTIQTENIGLLNELGKRYFNEYEKLRLYSSKVQSAKENRQSKESGNGEVDKIDFETSLYLLSEIFSGSTISALIQKMYDVQHGSTLFYQIVAHLFKNGFIDVVINFNFDELLDQAIKDEIEDDGYDLVLSDGDCKAYNSVSFDNKLRQPLYIKPHGTVSHKSTLRFTKNHYHELPQDMRMFLEELIASKTESSNLKVNLITVGFGMESLEFNDIIAKNLPSESRIISFFYHKDKNEDELGIYCQEKKDKLEYIFENKNKGYPEIKFIGHEFYSTIDSPGLESNMTTLGNVFYELHKRMAQFYKPEFQPPSIHRHLIISKLFGNSLVWVELNSVSTFKGEARDKHYPESYFSSSEYLKDRILIEILINLIANNGLLDPTLLMKGNVGVYYSQYFEEDKNALALADLITFSKTKEEVDILSNRPLISPLKIKDFNIEEYNDLESMVKKVFEPDKFFSPSLSRYLRNKRFKEKVFQSLLEHFLAIKNSNNSKIQSKLRSANHHMFRNYRRSDLVTNNLSYNLHFYTGVTDVIGFNTDTICITADYAHQLRHFMQLIAAQKKIKFIYVVLAYPTYKINIKQDFAKEIQEHRNNAIDRLTSEIANPNLKRDLGKIIKIRFRPIKRHNHHMTIFMNYDQSLYLDPTNKISGFVSHYKRVTKVIYYYKKGLSESINPIRIEEPENIQYLLEKYKYYADSAKREFMETKESEEPWITDDEWKEYLNDKNNS